MSVSVRRSNNRNRSILDAAAKLIASTGFHGTTIRDIAKASGMLPGSIYYHYPSKDALLLTIYEMGVSSFCERFDEAISIDGTPWQKLERAIESHIKAITDENDYSRIINRVMPTDIPQHEEKLRTLRDEYDHRFKRLIGELNLAANIDREFLRFMILGASNWTQFWFKPGGATPEAIANQFTRILESKIVRPG